MIAKFFDDNTKIVVEVDGVRGVLRYVGHANCVGCALEGICSIFEGRPCRAFSGDDCYMFIPESRLKKGGEDEQGDNA